MSLKSLLTEAVVVDSMYDIDEYIESYEFIKNVNCTISILHGTDDAVIPIKSAKKLYDFSFKDKTEFTSIEGGGHNNLVEFKGYQERINKILE